MHKRRNVLGHLAEEQQEPDSRKRNKDSAMEDYGQAKRALDSLHREMVSLKPSAARRLGEGMEETPAVQRLRMPRQLRMTPASTNVIESAFAVV